MLVVRRFTGSACPLCDKASEGSGGFTGEISWEAEGQNLPSLKPEGDGEVMDSLRAKRLLPLKRKSHRYPEP